MLLTPGKVLLWPMIYHPPNPIALSLWPSLLLLSPFALCFSHPILLLLLVYSWDAPTWVFSGVLFPQGSCRAHCSPPARAYWNVTLLFKIPPPYPHFLTLSFISLLYFYPRYLLPSDISDIWYFIHCRFQKDKHFGLLFFFPIAVSSVPKTVPGTE